MSHGEAKWGWGRGPIDTLAGTRRRRLLHPMGRVILVRARKRYNDLEDPHKLGLCGGPKRYPVPLIDADNLS